MLKSFPQKLTSECRLIHNNFLECFREEFGIPVEKCVELRRLPSSRVLQLSANRKWIRTEGCFGERVSWKNLSDIFSFANHAGEDFSSMEITGCTFRWSDLRSVSFANAHLTDVRFEHCDLEHCDFAGTHFEGVTFENCFNLDTALIDAMNVSREENKASPGTCFGEQSLKL